MSSELEQLEDLEKKTDEFIGLVFDYVKELNQQHLLGHLYDLKNSISEEICKKKSDVSQS